MDVEERSKRRDQSEITAAKYQALLIKCYVTKLLQTERYNKCKLCQTIDERIEHA
jgi:hypothetical protein